MFRGLCASCQEPPLARWLPWTGWVPMRVGEGQGTWGPHA